MSSETGATSPQPEGLQFDHAEFADPAEAVICAACRQPAVDHYYEINGVIVCGTCRDRIEGHLRGGSGFLRLLRAMAFGAGAAIAGAVIYFTVLHFFHLQIALISILCGYLVGKSVMKGSGGRGGWPYQVLAIVLTYLAVGMAYTGEFVASGGVDQMMVAQPGRPAPDPALIPIVKAAAVVFYVFASPILIATSRENFISMVIILFAFWEAWKFTKRSTILVTGPYLVGEAGPHPEPEGVADHA